MIYTALGDTVEFRCRHPTAEIIGWDINGTPCGRFHNVSSGSRPTADGVAHTLMIEALAVYNNTNVSCVAAFLDLQHPTERTPNVSLVVQGVY